MAYLKLSLDSDDQKTKMTSIWTSLESLQNIRWRRAKKKKQTLRRSPVYINFCKTVTMIARQNCLFFVRQSSILSGVESGKTKRQGRKAETLKKMVHLPHLYHFLSVDFKHFSWHKIYLIFFENICHDSFITGSPNFSPADLNGDPPAQFPRSTHYQFPSEHDEMTDT